MNELTKREQEVYDAIMQGLSPVKIAKKLGIKLSTMARHREHIYSKFMVNERYELMALEIKKLKGLQE